MENNANAGSANETETTEAAETEAKTEAMREAEENFRWRRERYLRQIMFGDIGMGDRRQMLWAAGRQIDWSKIR